MGASMRLRALRARRAGIAVDALDAVAAPLLSRVRARTRRRPSGAPVSIDVAERDLDVHDRGAERDRDRRDPIGDR